MEDLRIYKYPVEITDYVQIELPQGAKILSFQWQRDKAYIWAFVDPGNPKEQRQFRVVGTGQGIGADSINRMNYIGTAQTAGCALMWHLFEILA